MRRVLGAILVLTVVAAACGDDGGDDGAPPPATDAPTTEPDATAAPPDTPGPSLGDVAVTLTPIADVESPTGMAVREGDDTLYVIEQGGEVLAIRDGALDTEPVLDISGQIRSGGEQGLLGIAFAPGGSLLYLHYTDTSGDTRVDEYTMNADGSVDASSRREVLAVEQPQANHNGGQLAFGPDDLLYLGLGDGGGGGDRGAGHAPGGNGQSLDTLLGKIVRIDPRGTEQDPYTVPADNPFATGGGEPEIWAYGLRNPWRFSFDRETGDLWIGDVGQNAWEEINYVPAGEGSGANFGWPLLEGTHPFDADEAPGTVLPIFEFPNPAEGCSVTGGFVYRGARIPDLVGAYVFADWCEGEVRALQRDESGSGVLERPLGVGAPSVIAFGEDHDGELYVLSQGDGVQRIDPA